MRFATFSAGGQIHPGAVVDDEIVDLGGVTPDLLTIIEMGSSGLERARAEATKRSTVYRLGDVQLQAPIPRPRKNVVCIGMNYAEHAYESMRAKGLPPSLPDHPVFFTKASTAVNRPDGTVPFDPAVTEQLDWEVELAFVIGRTGKNIKSADALSYVWGYTIVNDISARDLQNRHQQFFKGKSLDGSCPMGPWIVTTDELPDASDLRLQLRVNGETLQDSRTSDLIFGIPRLIEVLSLGQTIEAGDIVATGTPSGVGMGHTPQRWLKEGDRIEAEIEGIGILRNVVGQR